MITIDGKRYLGVTLVFNEVNPPRNLVTYTVDGEPSAPLYTEHGSSDTELAEYLLASEEGMIRNLRFWRFDQTGNIGIGDSILGQFQ